MASKYIVCPRCEGEGTIVNPEVDGNGITSEMFDDDPDFLENYFSGVYDVRCPTCDGQRVVTRSAYAQALKRESEQRYERLERLQEMGIGPGHRDYF